MITTIVRLQVRATCDGCGQWHEYEVPYPQTEEDLASLRASAEKGLQHQEKCPRKEL